MAKYHKIALTAGLLLATALTFSCSGGDNDPPPGVSSSSVSSSSVSSSSESSSSSVPCESWTESVTAATCESAGLKTLTCASNSSETKTEEIAQLPWGDWEITRHASQDEHGEETRTCPTTPPTTETRELYMCGTVEYDPVDEFCQSSGVVKERCGGATYASTQFCDFRDETLYKFVSIGEGATAQIWMAENLNYDVPGNATDVCYQNNDDNCEKYGRLYNWSTAMGNSASSSANPSGVQGVCPAGWHLPSDAEWTALTTFVGGESTAGTKLKADSDLWSTNTGTDDFGFSALPGGYGYSDGSFYDVGNFGIWWSSTEVDASYAYYRSMYYSDANVSRDRIVKSSLFSVRCVQD